MDIHTLNSVRAELAALDLTSENEQIAALEADITRLRDAAEKGLVRRNEISAILRERQVSHARHVMDARAVADALLTDAAASEAVQAAPDTEALEHERASLQAAGADLRKRIEARQAEIADVQQRVTGRLAVTAAPLVAHLMAEARSAAASIIDCFAALTAVKGATNAGTRELRGVEQAVGGITAYEGLIEHRDRVDVPAEVGELLAVLASKGAAWSGRLVAAARVIHQPPSVLPMLAAREPIAA